jgi:putative intracellular protease/amidase
MPHRTYPAPSAIGPVVAGHSALGTWTLSVGDDRRSNATGRVDSWNITFHGSCGCPADVGAAGGLPGSDGQLNNNDFIAFISYFFAGDPHADMGTPGGLPGHDGQFDNNDFIAFISAFFNGCS